MQPLGKLSSGQCVLAAVVILLASAGSARAETRHRPLTGWDAGAVSRARSGAIRRLRDPRCQGVFSDFQDSRGRTIQQNLDEGGMSATDYLQTLPFVDGSREPLCRKTKVALAAAPGVPRVVICPAFADFQLRQPHLAESIVIHEALHTLGLGENPPSSLEITARVEARCR